MDCSMLVGTLLLAVGSISIACAFYTIQGNFEQPLKKLFLATGLSILAWNLDVAVTIAASDKIVGMIGVYLAPIGYSATFSMLLHSMLILADPKRNTKKIWFYSLVYLPGLLCVVGLSIAPALGLVDNTLVHTRFGWVDASQNPWLWYYYGHFAALSIAITALLLRWQKSADSESERRQAKWLLVSTSVCFLLGAATDVAMPLYGVRFPRIGCIFFVIPVIAIGRLAGWCGFMRDRMADPIEAVQDRATDMRIYWVTGICLIAGSLSNELAPFVFLQPNATHAAPLFSFVLFAAGCAAIRLGNIQLEESNKNYLLAILFSLIIPLTSLYFSSSGSVTVWAAFFLWLIISLLFNERLMLYTVILSAIQTEALFWCANTHVRVTLDAAYYLIRLALVAFSAYLCFFVNRVYRTRLKENAKHAIRQTLVSDVSHTLISVDENNYERVFLLVLMQCAKYLDCERACLALVDTASEHPPAVFGWQSEGPPEKQYASKERMADCFFQLQKRLKFSRILTIPNLNALPPEAHDLKEPLENLGVRSLVMLRILKNGEPVGFMCFSTESADFAWDEENVAFLPVVVNTVADAVSKLADTRKIKWIAYHDQLTGLPNRLLFHKRLDQAIQDAERNGTLVGVAFMDLDAFKYINDTMGHEVGDQLLVEVTKSISCQMKGYGSVARFGGDEFVLLFDSLLYKDDLIGLIQNVMNAIEMPIILQNQELFITASVGVSLYPQDGTNSEILIGNADIAMFSAKKLGKHRCVFCTQELKNKLIENARLSNLLYRALERDELAVYYQPLISMETHTIVGVEALLRWQLPDQGFVSPAVFIPLAEQTGQIQQIGAWVLETACRQCVRWRDAGYPAIRMTVNISVQQLRNINFVQQVADVLARSGLSAESLELEITESVANSGAMGMVELMTQLKELGVSLSIDDFGTEYSSLGRLKLLPIDRLKLDMQFVRGIERNIKDRAIAQVIINLAKNLHLRVVAEGVETRTQLDFLRGKLCDEVQGYYYYRPMPPEEFEKILQEIQLPQVDSAGYTAGEDGEGFLYAGRAEEAMQCGR